MAASKLSKTFTNAREYGSLNNNYINSSPTNSDTVPLIDSSLEKKNSQQSQNSTFVDDIWFSWLTPLLELGNTRPLEAADLYELNPSNKGENISNTFDYYWCLEKKKRNPSLAVALAKAFGKPFFIAGFLKLIHDSLLFVAPKVIEGVIGFLKNPDARLSEGLLYAVAMLLSGIIQSFCLRQYFYYCYLTGLRLRSAVVTAVYKKSLVILSCSSTGEVTNLMSIDAQYLQDLTPYLHGLWYGLFQISVSLYLLWQQLGVSCLSGVAMILVAIPLTALLARIMRTFQRGLLSVKDERVKICYEVLSGMKVIKLQAWEKMYKERVMSYRDKELFQLRKYIMTQAVSGTLFGSLTALVAVSVFMTYINLGNALNVSVALTSLSLLNILRFPLFMLPQVINNVVQAHVSFERLSKFLLEEEYVPVKEGPLTDTGILLENADFAYSQNKICLENISLEAKNGELLAVVGHVGSGKTTFIKGLLGDVKCIKGNVYSRGSVAYVSQQPFIQNASVRENILFGQPFDYKRYKTAIDVSALKPDLKVLPHGDQTEIGEKGINLSGGQRTRVSIARAVYQDAHVYLFDDPLSAVDSHVGAHIFEECILNKLQGKVRVFVTNAITFLPKCDNMIVLEKGKVVQYGTYKELMKQKNGILYSLVRRNSSSVINKMIQNNDTIGIDEIPSKKQALIRRSSSLYLDVSAENEKQLTSSEDRSTGDVSWLVYAAWVKAAGGVTFAVFLMIAYPLSQLWNTASTFWLSIWSEKATIETELFYLWVYVALQLSFFIGVFFRLIILYISSLRASRKLFEEVLERVVRAPMAFFDTTPFGRIINRLSKDISTIDEKIPVTTSSLIACIVGCIFTFLTICFVTPAFIILLVPICIGYYISQRYFIKTSRELQRLDNISRSPVFALLSETLDGITTIRAFCVEQIFVQYNNHFLDRNQRAYFLNFSANCWLGLRLEFAGAMVASGATLFAVLQHSTKNAYFAGLAGVSLSYAFTVTQTMNWSVRMLSQLETQMVSVERIKAYAEMEVEANLSSSQPPSQSWPQQGIVKFNDVKLSYREGLPLVLKGLTFQINQKEKVGIVGRTGAGKSSIITALMRLVELAHGSIIIDNVDISNIGLHELRSRLSIIPQDPVLFSGTVRTNLDPFQIYTDQEVWVSLKRAHLHSVIKSLNFPVSEGGSNFSVGERQLLCIARALLKKSRIILLDEATASIDIHTDALIQESIKTEFADCTCLTIAHRINTILNSDRVLVMDQGKVAEFDTVENLLQNQEGIFAGLVNKWREGAQIEHEE